MITLPTRTLFPAADNQVIPPPIILIQGESQGREISITMMDGDGTPLDLTAAAAVALYYTKPDGTEEQLPCTVEDAAGGTVSVAFTSSSCAVAGDMRKVILRITWSDASNSRYVGPRIHVAPSPSDTAAESSNEFALLDQLIIQAQEAIGGADEAASAANTAAGAVNDAKDAANTAASAANAAATAANTAKDAANAAAGAANAAAGAANTAAGAANTAADRANQAAKDAEAVLDGAVISVNGKKGAVTLAAADVGALAANDVADYVVAQGASGDWRYRKWDSGWAECWRVSQVTPTAFTANGTLYYTDIITIPYPFDFAAAPVAFVSSYNANVIAATMNGNNLGAISLRLATTTNTAASYVDKTIKIYVAGSWK